MVNGKTGETIDMSASTTAEIRAFVRRLPPEQRAELQQAAADVLMRMHDAFVPMREALVAFGHQVTRALRQNPASANTGRADSPETEAPVEA